MPYYRPPEQKRMRTTRYEVTGKGRKLRMRANDRNGIYGMRLFFGRAASFFFRMRLPRKRFREGMKGDK